MVTVIIMAGGLGKRMNSDLPKVLHKINGIPMIVKIIQTAITLNPNKILVVVGKYKELIENTINSFIKDTNIRNMIQYIIQETALGTGHAIQCCRDHLLTLQDVSNISNVLILSGDVPLISSLTLVSVLGNMNFHGNKASLITTKLDDPHGYGRIIETNDNDNTFLKIVEEKDCTDLERMITKINTGIYVFDRALLCKYLPYITNNNNQNEYYLTDIIEIIKTNEDINIILYEIPKSKQYEIIGVNTPEQLEYLSTFSL